MALEPMDEVEQIVFSVLFKKTAIELLPILKVLQNLAVRDDATLEALKFFNCQGRCLKLLCHPEEEVMEAASAVLANLAGTAACNAHTIEWSCRDQKLTLHQGAYVEAGLGYRLWPSATYMARLLLDGEIDVKGQDVLEIGCGVGVGGLMCAVAGCRSVLMTDYQQSVLRLVEKNIKENDKTGAATVCRLDWRHYLGSGDSLTGISTEDYQYEGQVDDGFKCHGNCDCSPIRTSFPVIIASDVVYDAGHADLVPLVIDAFLAPGSESVCHVVLPTSRYRGGIDVFDRKIQQMFHVTMRRDDSAIGREAERTVYTIRRKAPKVEN